MTGLIADGARLIVAESGRILAGDELRSRIAAAGAAYADLPPGLVLLRACVDEPTVLSYLGGWRARRPLALIDPALTAPEWDALIDRFRPAAVVGGSGTPAPAPYRRRHLAGLGPCWVRDGAAPDPPHPDLALLLTTSGSTGEPKLVRLSRRAVLANALAIAEALRISPDHTVPTSLPLHYSYGLSVLNSHLAGAASVILVDGGILSREFWEAVDRYGATTLNGVPRHYEMLHRLRWTPDRNPTVRVLTQAGGRMRPDLVRHFHRAALGVGGRFHVMWGQTEAAPRMSVLPSACLPEKAGSVGPPLPGGRLTIRTSDGAETTEPGVTGEVVYRGPNTMLGYASTAADLARGDDLGGVLRTGDLGHLDQDGCLWLTGRINRIGKVFGLRFDLDHVERLLDGSVAAIAQDDRIVVFCEGFDEERARLAAQRLAERLRLHPTGLDLRPVARLPVLANGKVDYRTLEAAGDE